MLVDINLSSGRPASSIRMNISMWHQYQQEIGYLFQKVVPKPKKMLHKHPNIHPFGKWEKKAAGIGNIYSGRIGRFERLWHFKFIRRFFKLLSYAMLLR